MNDTESTSSRELEMAPVTNDVSVDGADPATDDAAVEATEPAAISADSRRRTRTWAAVTAFGVLPVVGLGLALGAGYCRWQIDVHRSSEAARSESLQAATDVTVRILSYRPESVEQDLTSAENMLTGEFKNSYASLIRDVVIPGARDKHVSSVATVPAISSISATPQHAEALLFVDQTVTIGKDAPTGTASSVKVTLDKVDGHWMISGFDPV
ncbi:hypothetical protein ACWDTP_04810 [Mycobacterium sp. NPDC003449]